jgi:ribonuclease P protein component
VFDRFRTDGRRVRRGALWCSYIADATAVPPRVAYAVGRPVGSAVVRNRLRRQLRARVAAQAQAGRLPPGFYLFGATPSAAELDATSLTTMFSQLMTSINPQDTP